jgi:hypothetical protein
MSIMRPFQLCSSTPRKEWFALFLFLFLFLRLLFRGTRSTGAVGHVGDVGGALIPKAQMRSQRWLGDIKSLKFVPPEGKKWLRGAAGWAAVDPILDSGTNFNPCKGKIAAVSRDRS